MSSQRDIPRSRPFPEERLLGQRRALLHLLEMTQEDVADAIAKDRMPLPCPSFDADLGRLRSKLLEHEAVEAARLVEFLWTRS